MKKGARQHVTPWRYESINSRVSHIVIPQLVQALGAEYSHNCSVYDKSMKVGSYILEVILFTFRLEAIPKSFSIASVARQHFGNCLIQ